MFMQGHPHSLQSSEETVNQEAVIKGYKSNAVLAHQEFE